MAKKKARRNTLGLNAPCSPEVRAQRMRDQTLAIRKGVLNHAYGFAAHGNLTGAFKHIEAYIATDEDTLEARLWILNEAMRWENSDFALALGRRVIDYCEQHGFADEAATVQLRFEELNDQAQRGTAR